MLTNAHEMLADPKEVLRSSNDFFRLTKSKVQYYYSYKIGLFSDSQVHTTLWLWIVWVLTFYRYTKIQKQSAKGVVSRLYTLH